MKAKEEFNALFAEPLAIHQLAHLYIREVDPNETLQNLSNEFGIPLVRNEREFSSHRRYEQQRQTLRVVLLEGVINASLQQLYQQEQLRRCRYPLIPPKPTQQPPKVDWNRIFPNRPLLL